MPFILTNPRLTECKRLLDAGALIGHHASQAMVVRLEAAEKYITALLHDDHNPLPNATDELMDAADAWYASKGEDTP